MREKKQQFLYSIILIGHILLGLIFLASEVNANSSNVSGTVKYNTDKTPASGIRIFLAPQSGNGESCNLESAFSAITDKFGTFAITSVPDGRYFVFFGVPIDSKDSFKNALVPVSSSKLMMLPMFQPENKKLREPIKILEGAQMESKDGQAMVHGYFYFQGLNLLSFSSHGKLESVEILKDVNGISFEITPNVLKENK
jgi:hypothetical protein